MKTEIVTKQWLADKLSAATETKKKYIIGRALAAIYNRQTADEQSSTATIKRNGVGFSGPDARVGSIGARMFLAHKTVEGWVLNVWMRPASDSLPRICKYAAQLNDIATARVKREPLHVVYDDPAGNKMY